MDLGARSVALYGRFSAGVRDRFQREIARRGSLVARDLTRRTELVVVGALASALIDNGALPGRLRTARDRRVPVYGERGFAAALAGAPADPATLPLAAALGEARLDRDAVDVLAAFDLIVLDAEACRFADAAVLRTAADLIAGGRSLAQTVRILARARDRSPIGRRRIVLGPAGEAVLEWDDGLTTLEGQGFLPLDEAHASLEDLFDAATLAEAEGDLETAARLFDMCARADRRDAISPYNYANIRMAQGAHGAAALGYQTALARDGAMVEARYNLAQALEAAGKPDAAAAELARVIADDPDYADAVFNLAQLRLQAGALGEAKALYERYLALGPPEAWAATARKAILLCAARLSA
jgi:tetratricopeptide (TPR) repeat protein